MIICYRYPFDIETYIIIYKVYIQETYFLVVKINLK